MGNDIKKREKSFSLIRILKGLLGLVIPSSFLEKKPTDQDILAVAYYRVYLAQTVSKLIAGNSYKPGLGNGITDEGRQVANAMIRSDKYFSTACGSVIHIAKHMAHSIASGGATSGVGAVGVAYNAKNVVIPPIKYINELRSGTLTDHVKNAQEIVNKFECENKKMAKNRAVPTNPINSQGIKAYVNSEFSKTNMSKTFEAADINVSNDETKLVIIVNKHEYGIEHGIDHDPALESSNKYNTAPSPSSSKPQFSENTGGKLVSSKEFRERTVVPGFKLDYNNGQQDNKDSSSKKEIDSGPNFEP